MVPAVTLYPKQIIQMHTLVQQQPQIHLSPPEVLEARLSKPFPKRNLSTTIWPLKRLFKKKRSSKPQLTPLNGNGNVTVSAINSWWNSMTSRDWLLSKPRLKRSTQDASKWSITSKLCKSSASPTCLYSWKTYALSGRVSLIWSDFKSPRSLGIIKDWWSIWKRYKREKAS